VGALLSIVLVALLKGEAINVVLAYLEKQALRAWHWIQQPIDVALAAGLAFLVIWFAVWITVAIVAAYVEERRTLRAKPSEKSAETATPPLSAHDREAIHPARKFWSNVGKSAHGQAWTLLEEARTSLRPSARVALLLRDPLSDLHKSTEAMDACVHDQAVVPLAEVEQRLRWAFLCYIRVARWVDECEHPTGVLPAVELNAELRKEWEALHSKYVTAFNDLGVRPDYSMLRQISLTGTGTRFTDEWDG